MSKSEGLFLGAWRSRQDTPLSLTWHNDQLRLLGIVVGRGPNVVKLNWQLAVDKMGAVFNKWKGRDLPLVGRAVVAQSLAASKLWYVAQLVVPPWNVVDAANSDLWKFIWADHAQLVNRTTCSLPVRDGGLGGIILRTKMEAFQLQWISRLVDDSPCRWKSFAIFWFDLMASPFTDLRGLLDGNRTPIPSRVPPF